MRSFVIALVSAATLCLGAAYGNEEKVILEHRMGESNEFIKRAELSITYRNGVATSIKLIGNQTHLPATYFDGSEIYQIRLPSGNPDAPYYVASIDPVNQNFTQISLLISSYFIILVIVVFAVTISFHNSFEHEYTFF